jgi:PTH1 family peptidyl-tRNA hydrolase
MRYYRIAVGDVLVVTDDANLPLGRLRARSGGSDGGHNGLSSVIESLGADTFARLRIGVGHGEPRRGLANHVLARFDEAEREEITTAVVRAADAVGAFVGDGIDVMMNRFNRKDDADLDHGHLQPTSCYALLATTGGRRVRKETDERITAI